MNKGWLFASFAVSLWALGCGSSGGGGTGGGGGHGGAGAHAGSGGHAGSPGTGGGGGGHAGTSGGGAGGSVGGGGGHAGGGGATGGNGGHAGTGGVAGGGGHGGTGGSAGGAGTGGAAGGGGQTGAGGTAGSSGGTAGGGAGGTSSVTDGGTDGPLAACGTALSPSTEGINCSDLDARGPCVTIGSGSGTAPAAAGGTIVAGTYELTSSTVYLGDGAFPTLQNPIRKTVVITGSASPFTMSEADAAGTNYLRRQTGTLTVSGAMITFSEMCPSLDAGSGNSVGFTATATTLTVFEPHDQNTVIVEVYQKRS
jgi:hypothetical protein